MRHRWHDKAETRGTRLITAVLVVIVGAVSLAADTVLWEHNPTVHSARARQDEHPHPNGPRKVTGRPVRHDVVAPRLEVPDAVRVRTRMSTGGIVHYRAVAVDATDGVVTASCAPASGTWFPAGRTVVSCSAMDRAGNVARDGFVVVVRARPGGAPSLLCFPDDGCHATREWAAWTSDR